MNTDYVVYQRTAELWQALLIDWKSDITTVKYWCLVAFVIISYLVWYKLTDKRRLVDLLLYGSFVMAMRELIDLFGVMTGYWQYKMHILPLPPSIFLSDWVIVPLVFMLVQQHSSNWRQFFVWNALGTALIVGVFFQILGAVDLVKIFRGWNYIFTFTVMYTMATLARAAFHLVIQVQEDAREGKTSPLKNTLMQPAFKPLQDRNEEKNDD